MELLKSSRKTNICQSRLRELGEPVSDADDTDEDEDDVD